MANFEVSKLFFDPEKDLNVTFVAKPIRCVATWVTTRLQSTELVNPTAAPIRIARAFSHDPPVDCTTSEHDIKTTHRSPNVKEEK